MKFIEVNEKITPSECQIGSKVAVKFILALDILVDHIQIPVEINFSTVPSEKLE